METKEVMFNGKKVNIVTKLDDDFKNDRVLFDEFNSNVLSNEYSDEDTLDLTNVVNEIKEVSGDKNE